MFFHELFNLFDPDVKLAIDFQMQRYPYTVEDLREDFVFYEEIKDREVNAIWYSRVYDAIIVEIF